MNHLKKRGFTLFEVLVSMTLLAILLLGLDVMEVYSLQRSLDTHYRQLALRQLRNAENRLGMIGAEGDFNEQSYQWKLENEAVLPQAKGLISGSYPSYTLSLCWATRTITSTEEQKGKHQECLTEQLVVPA